MINVVITRPLKSAEKSARLATELGLEPIIFPMIKVSLLPSLSWPEELSFYDYIVFTSTNAVYFFDEIIKSLNISVPQIIKIAAVGDGTSKVLTNLGYNNIFVPSSHTSLDLGKQLPKHGENKVLYPALEGGPQTLENILRKRDFQVHRFNIYRSARVRCNDSDWKNLKNQNPDMISFFSPRTVEAFMASRPEFFFGCTLMYAALGNSTNSALQNYESPGNILDVSSTPGILFKGIKKYYDKKIKTPA